MPLLERDRDLSLLAAALDDAMTGQGRVALVSGEAGIGKTSLISHFIAQSGKAARVLTGYCDSLFTPTPLAPLHDIAHELGGRLLAQLERDAPRAHLFATMLDILRDPAQPTLLVFEDIHWADEATLDLLKYLGRRIAQTRSLLILSYRPDEIGARHPLHLLLGDLASSRATLRLALRRLTLAAVRDLVGSREVDAALLHRQTAGNPFFLTEVLSANGHGIPDSVNDSVQARLARLNPSARHVLETAAIYGSRMGQARLEVICGAAAEDIDAAMRSGLLEMAGQEIIFRHELVRDAILAALAPGQLRELCRRILAAMRASGIDRVDLAQMAHLAEGAQDAEAVLAYGPDAAKAAAAVGAHRAAAAQYKRTFAFAQAQPPAQRARLLDSYAEQCAIIDNLGEAIAARRQAIGLWREAGDPLQEGATLSNLAWPLVRSGQNAAAEDASRQAITLLEALPPTRELAAACRMQAHLRMLDRDKAPAVHWGKRAIELATRFEDRRTLASAELVVGAAMLVSGDDNGLPHYNRSVALARADGMDDLVGLAFLNLGSSYGELYQFDKAEALLREGIAYAEDCDLDHSNNYMSAWLALTLLYKGLWDEAGDHATAVVNCPNFSLVSKVMALVALGRLRVRRGDPGIDAVLDEALDLARQTNTLQRLAPVHAARAEAAWFAGDKPRAAAEATAAYELAMSHRHQWHVGEFTYWRRRAGEDVSPPRWCAKPFALQIAGDWKGAAAAWRDLKCPYEEARALADGDGSAQLSALDIFDRLGAAPAAALLRQRLRETGTRRIPRGPRATTLGNPHGLTSREMGVLDCLACGLSNGQIGIKLHISPKTVDHHVSAILAKLAVKTRAEAAAHALAGGLVGQNREVPMPK
ncbi:AAA family ATPase [Nordella sp. HKS 07]|uniref:helix-turn-helix transcriptional regulator n=1 Tax=Nordella sp. HKS 07 TaxID=2712222 RepID=UPI0013E18DA5|nr:LuxR family transcriptional regulator [Nordella sp. HKS 07]QIG47233.1 AAA family ATPase [Nordella sp. HKS 07]